MSGEPPSAVRLYPLDHPALAVSLRRMLQQERDKLIVDVGCGVSKSFEDYRYRTGIIEGLRLALMLAEQSEKELTQRN